MSKLTYTPIGSYKSFNVSFKSLSLGELIINDYGYYAWYPCQGYGYLDAWALKDIVNKLDELNEPWDNKIKELCKTT